MKLYNTFIRAKQHFTPAHNNQVKLYACGPTVYDYAHIGHYRAYIFVDVLRRALMYNGYELTHVMNITDVGHLTDDADCGEDKVEVKALKENKSVWEIAKFYTDDFFEAMDSLGVERPEIVCKATDHINEMIDFIRAIENRGFAYKTSDGIYFDTSKLEDYGKLAKLNLKELQEGARVEPNPEKRSSTDFALWKFSPKDSKRQMEWNSPWGVGFPGWHIECSAMGIKYLGATIDIHTGGIDHIPVHHTNEIAQAEGAYGRDTVRLWMHNEFLLVDGEKMSKSKGNFYRLEDIAAHGITPMAARYFFLTAHYRTPINFTWEGLKGAEAGLERLYEKMQNTKCLPVRSTQTGKMQNDTVKFKINKNSKYYKNFVEAIDDDLNTSKALAVLWDMLKDKDVRDDEKLILAYDFDTVLGLKLSEIKACSPASLPPEIKKLSLQREEARASKDYARSDELRLAIEDAGYEVRDTSDGQIVVKKEPLL